MHESTDSEAVLPRYETTPAERSNSQAYASWRSLLRVNATSNLPRGSRRVADAVLLEVLVPE